MPTIEQFGSVTPSTGTATISGTVICNQPAYVYISGELKEVHAGTPIDGNFFTAVACNGATPWSVTVQTQSSLFHGRSALLYTGGRATVAGTASAFDPDSGDYLFRNFSVTITLRGAN